MDGGRTSIIISAIVNISHMNLQIPVAGGFFNYDIPYLFHKSSLVETE